MEGRRAMRRSCEKPRANEEEEVGKAERSQAREEAGQGGNREERQIGVVRVKRGHEEVVLSVEGWEGEVEQWQPAWLNLLKLAEIWRIRWWPIFQNLALFTLNVALFIYNSVLFIQNSI
jgi:hypothetical protein